MPMQNLKHYGVKGMKWGVRKDEEVLNRLTKGPLRPAIDISPGRPKTSRQERKATRAQGKKDWAEYKSKTTKEERKTDKKKAIESKLNYLVSEAAKDPMRGFSTIDAKGNYHLVTGQQFMEQLARGGHVNVAYTDITVYRSGRKD